MCVCEEAGLPQIACMTYKCFQGTWILQQQGYGQLRERKRARRDIQSNSSERGGLRDAGREPLICSCPPCYESTCFSRRGGEAEEGGLICLHALHSLQCTLLLTAHNRHTNTDTDTPVSELSRACVYCNIYGIYVHGSVCCMRLRLCVCEDARQMCLYVPEFVDT